MPGDFYQIQYENKPKICLYLYKNVNKEPFTKSYHD